MSTAAPAAPRGHATRERILDEALRLMARQGADATGMRAVADACGVNVAAIYYHFPSKAALLRAVIEERHYELLLQIAPVDRHAGSPRTRLRDLVWSMWRGAQREEQVWRLLIAESCHHNEDAREVAAQLLASVEAAVAEWLGDVVGQLRVPTPVAARIVVDALLAFLVECAIRGGEAWESWAASRADDLAAALV